MDLTATSSKALNQIMARHQDLFGPQGGDQANAEGGGSAEDDKDNKKKARGVPFHLLSQDEREVVFRVTSAKKDRKR